VLVNDPRPLCPNHGTFMVAATHWIQQDSKPFPKPCSVCPRTNCLYVHDLANGFYTLPEDAPIGRPVKTVTLRFKKQNKPRSVLSLG
jgi:hypothetical protein